MIMVIKMQKLLQNHEERKLFKLKKKKKANLSRKCMS